MKTEVLFLNSFILTIMLFVVSCQAINEEPQIISSKTPDNIRVTSLLTPTLPPASKAISTNTPFALTPTPIIAPSPKPILTLIPISTNIPATLTLLPTISTIELETVLNALLENPMNCDIPCWWDATTNQTTIFEIRQFLKQHQIEIRERDDRELPDLIEAWIGYDENENRFDFRVISD